MKLYTSLGTNPKVVQLFLAHKNIDLESIWVDIAEQENRRPDFLQKNPLGQLPVLELANGQCISQTTAICEYLEELHPTPALIGDTPEERAETRMWLRRNDLLVIEPLVQAFKYSHGLPYYQARIHCIPGAVDDLNIIADQGLEALDELIKEHTWICGSRFTLADIQLYCFLDFACNNRQTDIATRAHLARWFEHVRWQLNLDGS